MCDESEKYSRLVGDINRLIQSFPKEAREHWVKKAVTATPDWGDDFADRSALRDWLSHLGRAERAPIDDSVTTNASPRCRDVLTRFSQELDRFSRCSKECLAVRRILARWPKNPVWSVFDGLAEAMTDNSRLVDLARSDPGVKEWIGKAFQRERLHPIDVIVPPLTLDDLTTFRRSLDKHRKRASRDLRPLSLQAADFLAVGVLGGTVADADCGFIEDDLEVLRNGMELLDPMDRLIWSLRTDGKKLAEIAHIVGLSKSRVCERLARAVDHVAQFVEARK